MAPHISHDGFDAFSDLADSRSTLLDKLDPGEAVETLFAFAMAEGLISSTEPAARLRVSADTATDTIVIEVSFPGVRKETETLSLSEELDWDKARVNADGYARALAAALDAASAIEPRSRLP